MATPRFGSPLAAPQAGAPIWAARTSGATRFGLLDIGSNWAQLQIVDLGHGAPPLPGYAVKQAVGLVEDIGDDAAISEPGVDRVVRATRDALEAAMERRAAAVVFATLLSVFATAAVRDAWNGEQASDRIEEPAKVQPQYLGGEAEARHTYLAAHRWNAWSANRILLLGIGGGFMEVASGRDAGPLVGNARTAPRVSRGGDRIDG